jgi:protein-S-isoprenylcysteine O-methyltransferase Ste14
MNKGKTNPGDLKARLAAAAVSTIFLFVTPGTVAGFLPWWIGRWRVHAPFVGFTVLRVAGSFLMAVGAVILVDAFLRFALKGLGTPAPFLPPKHLVVTGTYRYVRNPMYVAVVALIAGQGLFFGDLRVLAYGGSVWLVMHLFVLVYEEPALRRTFSGEYADFCAHVSRWLPRMTPWQGSN